MAESANTNGPKQIDLYGLKTLLQTKIQDKLQSDKPNIIFLAGPSASGKSTVTKALKAILPDTATLKTDHFLKSHIELSEHPTNKGKPVSEWEIVHGHKESYHNSELESLLLSIKRGEPCSYQIPTEYREDVKLESDPYPRGIRNFNGPCKTIEIPVSKSYIIEGIITPHLISDNSHVLVQLDVDFASSAHRRNSRMQEIGIGGLIPKDVLEKESKSQYDAVKKSLVQLGEKGIKADIMLNSTAQQEGFFIIE